VFRGNAGDCYMGGADCTALDFLESALGVVVGAADVSHLVNFTTGMPDTAYQPKVTFAWNAGASSITGVRPRLALRSIGRRLLAGADRPSTGPYDMAVSCQCLRK
jgi:hypothetical protein